LLSTDSDQDVASVLFGSKIEHMFDDLARIESAASTDAERLAAIALLERRKAETAAAQARLTEAFERSQRAAAPATKSAAEVSRSICAQVALARQEPPARGQRHVGVALALVRDMPSTLACLEAGRISEWRATLLVRETAVLARHDRQAVDLELRGRLEGAGDHRVADLARSIAQRLDPGAAMRRQRKAEGDRRVSVRPAPDTMCHLTGLLPVAQGVAAFAALRKQALASRNAGDSRTIGQLMADLMYERLTGTSAAPGPNVEIQLVMTDRTLMSGSHESGLLPGHGRVPAALARRLVREADKAWLRRLYAAPLTGELVATDSRRRTFPGRLRELLVLRDQTCRTPWCDAPVAHVDHVRPVHRGGRTARDNGQGLCETCNYVKESPGWRLDLVEVRGHVVEVTTPTGHRYRSRAPALPGADPPATGEEKLRRLRDDVA
jgi:hypothetical protein